MYNISNTNKDDIPDILRLINNLYDELWNVKSTMTKENLENDVFCDGSIEHVILAGNANDEVIGYLAEKRGQVFIFHESLFSAACR